MSPCRKSAGRLLPHPCYLPPVKLKRVQEFIQEHLSEPITLEQMAEVASYSMSRFLLLFRNATGHSPYQYVMRQRLERASDLLAHSNHTLAHIALACGFADQSHLIRLFKRHTGMTPHQMRQSGRQGKRADRA